MKHSEEALLSKKLVHLDTSVAFPQDNAFFALKSLDKEGLKKFYASMRFNTLIRELEQSAQTSSTITPQAAPQGEYHIVDSEEALQQLISLLSQQKAVCINTQASGHTHPLQAELIGIGFGIQPKEAWYVPLKGTLGKEMVLKALTPLLTNSAVGFYGHNLKQDYHLLSSAGINLAHLAFDTQLASYLLNTHIRRHSLDELVLECFGYVKTSLATLTGKGKQQISTDAVPIEKMALYCCEEVDFTTCLKDKLEQELEKRGLSHLYYNLELPLMKVLAQMEQKGIYLDAPILIAFGKELERDLHLKSQEIYELAGEEFNLNSPQQISKILFEKMGIYPPKGASTSADVLEILKLNYPIAGKIQEYRILEKLRSTYVDVLPTLINPQTHRIHTTFNQFIAATGRLSSQDPNLQNIPVRAEVGLKIREAFRPEKPGWSFLAADYSQIELRLLAHLSEDPVLMEAFEKDEDIHQYTASVVFHVPLKEVTKEMRSGLKRSILEYFMGKGLSDYLKRYLFPKKRQLNLLRCILNSIQRLRAIWKPVRTQLD